MATASVPDKVVQLLKKQKGGLNGIITELKTEHGIVANKGKDGTLTIDGDDDKILDLAIDMLEEKVKTTSTKFYVENGIKKELGEKCTVKWTFAGRQAVNIKRLFKAEVDRLNEVYELLVPYGGKPGTSTFSKNRSTSETVVVSCPYNRYSKVNDEIEKLESALQDCKSQDETVISSKDKQKAKDFANKQMDSKYYYDYESGKLTVYGKDHQSLEVAVDLWKAYLNNEENKTDPEPTTDDFGLKNDIDSDDKKYKSSQHALASGVRTGEFDDSNTNDMTANNTIKRTPGKLTGSGKNTKYCFEVNGLNVLIYKHSITEIKNMDAITNAANDRMMHGGGVAHFISKAAGSDMDADCKQYIKEHTQLAVTKNFVSIPGKLKCNGIIHAVGPIWSDYQDKVSCAEDLYKTIWNVLSTTTLKSWRTVALPAISSGIYGVPKKLCAEMYIKAFVDFGCQFGDVLEVHFVDLNQDILDLVRKTHEGWVADPARFSYYNDLILNQRRGDPILKLSGEKLIPHSKETVKKYLVNDKLILCAYQGDLTRLSTVDIIAIPVSSKADGNLVRKFKAKLGMSYATCVEKNRKSPENTVFVHKSGTAWPDIANIMLASNDDDPWKQHQALSNTIKTLLLYPYKGKKSLAMPLIGYDRGPQQTVEEISELLIQTIIDVSDENVQIQEIHLVNYDFKTNASVQGGLQKLHSECWIKHMPIDVSTCKYTQTNATVKTKPPTSADRSMSTGQKCPICLEALWEPKEMPCTHVMCSDCYDAVLKQKPQCPICGFIVGVIRGNQPPGVMYYRFNERQNLPGFESESRGTIIIRYSFPGGKQSENHPNPGVTYKGISRKAFLPHNKEGNEILELLRIAYDRKLIFTIGVSNTTGEKGVITWNDIHHKTNPYGGQQSFGYPDSTYLQRVRQELKDKGVIPPQTKKGLYPTLPPN